jgi:hypothetical protein
MKVIVDIKEKTQFLDILEKYVDYELGNLDVGDIHFVDDNKTYVSR